MKTLLYANQMRGVKTKSTKGIVGHVDEFYFDDKSWKIRYLVLDVGSWLTNRKVLISRATIGSLDWHNNELSIKATKEQIQKSPEASTDLPVALVLEAKIAKHYGLNYSPATGAKAHDPHLRSTMVLTDISVVTKAGNYLGSISDFLIDPETWGIAFVAVNRGKSGNVLLSPKLIRGIDVSRRQMRIIRPV